MADAISIRYNYLPARRGTATESLGRRIVHETSDNEFASCSPVRTTFESKIVLSFGDERAALHAAMSGEEIGVLRLTANLEITELRERRTKQLPEQSPIVHDTCASPGDIVRLTNDFDVDKASHRAKTHRNAPVCSAVEGRPHRTGTPSEDID